jgi:hypothetical protein
MMRRRGAVHGGRESEVVEVGLDELLRPGYVGADPGTDGDNADQATSEEDAYAGTYEEDAYLGTYEDAYPGTYEDAEPGTYEDAYPGTYEDAEPGSFEDGGPDTVDAWRADQPEQAGASFGVAFFGWLVAGGTVVLLLAFLGAAGTLLGWDKLADWSAGRVSTAWLLVGAWVVLVLTMGIGAFAGGYVGGRMVPSHGARQGLGVWFFGWGAVGLIVGLGYLADRKYDLLARIDWPTVPIAEADRTTTALLALVAILLVTLVGAVWGGIAGNSCCARLNRLNHRDEAMTGHRETG